MGQFDKSLEVELRGKITDLEAKLKKSNKLLKETGKVADETADKVKDAADDTDKMATAVEKAAKALVAKVAGVTAAIGGVILILDALGQRGNKISTALNFLSGDTDNLAEAQRELATATAKGVSSAQAEIETLNILLAASRDEARSKGERQEAMNRINKEYSDLLPNLDLENIGTQKVTEAVDALNKSLVREAKIRGAQNLIAKETEKLLLEQEKSALDAASGWDILFASLEAGLGPAASANLATGILTKGLKTQDEEISKSEAKIKAFVKRLQILLGEDLAFDRVTDPKLKAPKVEKIATRAFFTDDELAKRFGLNDAAQKKLEDRAAKTSARINKAIERDLDAKPVKAYLSEIEKALIEFNDNTRNLVENSIANTFKGIGDAIGEALANGGNILSAVGSAVVNAFGGFLSEMGSLMIQYGTLAVTKGILDKVVASGGPQSIVAGAAAIAVGVALSAAGSAIQSRAAGSSGTVAGQGTGGGSSSIGSGSISSFGGAGGGGRVVFEIAGNKLLGVLENTQNANLRIGG